MSEDEVNQTAELLARLEPGFVPYPIFEQLARIVALPILEIIPLHLSDKNDVEVLLIEREANDALWPGALHTPGTVIRATDAHSSESQNWKALDRVLQEELQATEVGPVQYVGSMLHESKRGVEQAQLYWVEVLGEPKVGTLYSVQRLPENLIASQRDFIRLAAEQFKKAKS